MSAHISNVRPKPDKVLVDIADYVSKFRITSKEAYETARYCLMDTLGCGLEALEYPACTKLLGPVVPGTVVPNGAKVPGTQFQLDPVHAAFNIGALIRSTPIAGYVGCAQAIARIDVTDRLHGVKAPTLVIVGSDDLGTPPAMSEAIAAAIPGARLEVIADASHLSNIEQAQAFNTLLLDFLTEK